MHHTNQEWLIISHTKNLHFSIDYLCPYLLLLSHDGLYSLILQYGMECLISPGIIGNIPPLVQIIFSNTYIHIIFVCVTEALIAWSRMLLYESLHDIGYSRFAVFVHLHDLFFILYTIMSRCARRIPPFVPLALLECKSPIQFKVTEGRVKMFLIVIYALMSSGILLGAN